MNKKLILASLFCLGTMTTQAQVSNINPVPQQVENLAEFLIDIPAEWTVVTDKTVTSSYALDALNTAAPAVAPKAAFKVTLGWGNQKAIKKYKKLVPTKAEGYYFKVTDKEIVIAAADERGAFYGVQSLLAMMKYGKLQTCAITDFPDVAFRGVVEGFYGTPWSQEDRLSQFDFYAKNKMNVYIYGPKDDPYHRDKWRVPYPAEEAARLKVLLDAAHKNGVNFYWAIHPGVDIKWTEADRDAMMNKLETMYQLGVRSFAVFFDDIWGEGTKADKQADLLNYINTNFVKAKGDVSPLVMCPTEYNRGWANEKGGYLRTLGSDMDKSVEIMWTGNSVVHTIDKESMEWINERIQRKGYIWLNFPVSDFVRDHILLGPTYGNGLDIADDLSGFVSNPMEHAESSKIALYSIADYTWNMKNYDYMSSWDKALKDLLPESAEALKIWASYNEDLGPNGHGFRRDESRELQPIAKAAVKGDKNAIAQLYGKCMELELAINLLLADKTNPALIVEQRPWLEYGKLVAQFGMNVCATAMTNLDKASGFINFDNLYKEARSIQAQMYNLANSDILHPHQPGIKVGSLVLIPTLNEIFANTVNAYNAAHNTAYSPVCEYQPYSITSTVPQLAKLTVTARGNDVRVNDVLEVVNWAPGAEFVINSDRAVSMQGMDFNFGVKGVAEKFTLELQGEDGNWRKVSLLHYSADDTVIHTGGELTGMKAQKIRLTNTSGEEVQAYFKGFRFSRQ
ncbi:MAG: beta-N-acetylglucosaminidase domain-containing protein [Bacteroidaceae bacterium]|nr:beta-N-acetylglucosaminidase domain-containing protein [Bacteroidaceae bacterium]